MADAPPLQLRVQARRVWRLHACVRAYMCVLPNRKSGLMRHICGMVFAAHASMGVHQYMVCDCFCDVYVCMLRTFIMGMVL